LTKTCADFCQKALISDFSGKKCDIFARKMKRKSRLRAERYSNNVRSTYWWVAGDTLCGVYAWDAEQEGVKSCSFTMSRKSSTKKFLKGPYI
jgi:hypothetical protein